MKKFIKNNLMGFIIGIIIASGISVLAVNYLYQSYQVSYDGAQPNVEKALNELYELSSNISNNDDLFVGNISFPTYNGFSSTNTLSIVSDKNYADYVSEDFYYIIKSYKTVFDVRAFNGDCYIYNNLPSIKYDETNGIITAYSGHIGYACSKSGAIVHGPTSLDIYRKINK